MLEFKKEKKRFPVIGVYPSSAFTLNNAKINGISLALVRSRLSLPILVGCFGRANYFLQLLPYRQTMSGYQEILSNPNHHFNAIRHAFGGIDLVAVQFITCDDGRQFARVNATVSVNYGYPLASSRCDPLGYSPFGS